MCHVTVLVVMVIGMGILLIVAECASFISWVIATICLLSWKKNYIAFVLFNRWVFSFSNFSKFWLFFYRTLCCSILSDHSRVSKIGLPLRIDLFFWITSLIADHVEPQVYVHFYTSCLHKGFHRRNIRWHRHIRSYLQCSHILSSSSACI